MKHLKNLVVKLEDSLNLNELSNIEIDVLRINLYLNQNKEKDYFLDLTQKITTILTNFKKNEVNLVSLKYDTDAFIDDIVGYAIKVRKDRWEESEELILNLSNRNETIISYIIFVYEKYGVIPEIDNFFKNLLINYNKISKIRNDTRAVYLVILYSNIIGGPFEDLDNIFKIIYENLDETFFDYNDIDRYVREVVNKNLQYSSYSNVSSEFKKVLKKYPYLEKIILKLPKFTSHVMTEYLKGNWGPGKEVLMKSNDAEAVYNYLFFSYRNDNQKIDLELQKKLFTEFPQYSLPWANLTNTLIPDEIIGDHYDFSETQPIIAIKYINALINKKGLYGEKLIETLRTTYKTLFDIVIKNADQYTNNNDFIISFNNFIKKIGTPFPELEEALINLNILYLMYDYLHYAITLYSEENNYDPEDRHSKLIKAIFDCSFSIGLEKIRDYFYLRSGKRSKIIEDYVFPKKLNNYKYDNNWIYVETYINEFIKKDDFRKKYEKLLLDNYDKIVEDVDVNNVSSSDPLYQYYSIARNNKIEIPEKISKLFRKK